MHRVMHCVARADRRANPAYGWPGPRMTRGMDPIYPCLGAFVLVLAGHPWLALAVLVVLVVTQEDAE